MRAMSSSHAVTKPRGSPSSSATKRALASSARSTSGRFASQLTSAHAGAALSAFQRSRRRRTASRSSSVPWRIVMRAADAEAGEEVVGAQVLEGVEAGSSSHI